jgi:FkbM family methyltransferase
MPSLRFVRFAQQLPGYRLGRWCYRRIRPLTLEGQNGRYDAETVAVMERVLRSDSGGLDIGAHAGSILRDLVRLAPRGSHWAFEPLPAFAAGLRAEFPLVEVCEVALSDVAGTAAFHHAVAAPGWSGLKWRDISPHVDTRWEVLTVQTARLDDLIAIETPVAFVKIDVEGGELGVLRGGERLFRRHRPIIVFEHGLGSADVFGTRPEDVWDLLTGWELQVRRWRDGSEDGPRSPGVPSCFTSNAAGQSTSSPPRGSRSFEGVLDAKAGRHWPDTRYHRCSDLDRGLRVVNQDRARVCQAYTMRHLPDHRAAVGVFRFPRRVRSPIFSRSG